MFEALTTRLTEIFDQLRRRGRLGEDDVDAALREVRLALLEADVHYGVTRELVARVRARAVGTEVSRALNPAQQVIKIVHEELIKTLGEAEPLHLSGPRPRVVMLVGLQGSGKTTAAAKLAYMLRSTGERVLMAAGDQQRPAAEQQLRQLGERMAVEVFSGRGLTPSALGKNALQFADNGSYGVVIVDTAGRSQLDDSLMEELTALETAVRPSESLLVLDAMLGQEAVNVAQGFRGRIGITGLVMNKLDGDARGGAAISVRSVTGIPLKFLGTGEKLDALEKFDPARLASRILGKGDVIGLIERAERALNASIDKTQAERMLGGSFDLEDWLGQVKQVRKMGPLAQIADMLPGRVGEAARQADPNELERGFRASEAIIGSMTPAERHNPEILNASRRRRIAAGSGTAVQDVNRLIKQFREAQKLMKSLKGVGPRGLPKGFG
jgi:signal recognition particle subunit SRP54